MIKNFLTNPLIATAVSKIGLVQLTYLTTQINPSEIAQWLSIATSVGVMIDTVFKWIKSNFSSRKKTSIKDKSPDHSDSTSNIVQPNIDSLKSE